MITFVPMIFKYCAPFGKGYRQVFRKSLLLLGRFDFIVIVCQRVHI